MLLLLLSGDMEAAFKKIPQFMDETILKEGAATIVITDFEVKPKDNGVQSKNEGLIWISPAAVVAVCYVEEKEVKFFTPELNSTESDFYKVKSLS